MILENIIILFHLFNMLVYKLTSPLHSRPLVSIIMPCYNSEQTVGKAIESVLSQDYINFELVIVDDGSSDCSIAIIDRYLIVDDRIKLLRSNINCGVSSARNKGLDVASGKFICFLDSDDYLLPGSIAVRVAKLIEINAKIVYGPYIRLLSSGELLIKSVPSRVSLHQMLMRNYIGNLTGMYDAEYLGKFRLLSLKHEDYLMWCQLLRIEKYAYSTGEDPIAVYRVSSNSLSGNKFKAFIWHWIVLRRGLSVGFFSSLYFQLFYSISSLFERFLYSLIRWRK